ncbi:MULTISPECIES: RDD family protein [unclassified Pseudoalteromonas]|uniref:RDD family protein n=1 Tax=unclassified Pseudoalteromonas TaxID=194690 RepID=UPI000CB41F0E|nr:MULTISPECIES: RDD family protein [unclassified Pseudoalteromonas]MBH0044881.1 RDD family protein [Pseudoalteromonas sp. NZS11_1]PLT26983.1 hypothetical protein CXF89_01730 [Pseudoalteromonas sp. MelDa3]
MMKCDVIYRGISNKNNIASLAGVIKRCFPGASKADVIGYLKQDDLVLFTDLDEEKANKIEQAIIKFGGKVELQFKHNNEDLFNLEDIEEVDDLAAEEEIETVAVVEDISTIEADAAQESANENDTIKVDTFLIAKPWKRVAALCVDQLITMVFTFIITYLILTFFPATLESVKYLGFVLSLVYFTLMTGNLSGGKTIGARLLKIKVIDEHSAPLNLLNAFIRSIVFLVGFAFFLISAISIFFNPKRRGFHDLMSGAYVVQEETSSFISSNAFTVKAQKMAFEQLKRAQTIGMVKLQESVVQINSSIPYLENAGYIIEDLEMEVGVSPKVNVIIKMNSETTLSMEELEEKVKDKPVVAMLVRAIKMSADLQRKVNIRSMKSVGMEISLAVTPSVKLLFTR